MKKTIHVHQQRIRSGDPAIIVRTSKKSHHFSEVVIDGPSTIVHSPDPDRCGARVWITTTSPVTGYVNDEELVIA